jgi:asparagine synthase (glutamine-hydrolysing)
MFSLRELSVTPEIKKSEKEIINDLKELFTNSMTKLIPNEKYGLMFSGGVDSSLVSLLAKKINTNFICYTVALEGKIKPKDLIISEKIAEEYKLKLKIINFKLEDIENYFKRVKSLIPDPDVIKISVGVVTYLCCEQARKDGINILFSGLGSEEIFAGYQRHKNSENINEECLEGLKYIEERDISRDEAIANFFGIKLATPFLDIGLVKYSLRIPSKYKINKENNKLVIRKVAESFGLKHEYAFRKKLAAQYGSSVDKALEKSAKKNGFKFKSDYLNNLKN